MRRFADVLARWVSIALLPASGRLEASASPWRASPPRLALLAFAAFAAIPASAAAPAAQSRTDDDLRPVYATPADVADGKRVAEASCASCHGINGVGTAEGVPHLAAQRAAYLYMEMKAYRAGSRGDARMTAAVKFLSDGALAQAAAYYASLEPAPPAPAEAKAAQLAAASRSAASKTATAACAGCHGDTGTSTTPGTPSLAGLDAAYLIAAMKAYQHGQRKDDMMKAVLASLGDAELQTLAAFYASQPRKPGGPSNAADVSAGKAAATACTGCHDDAATGTTPSLSGQDAAYLAGAVKAYRDGTRADDTMKGLAMAVDEPTMRKVAAYYSAQKPRAPAARKALTVAEWVQRCDRCHGVNGNSTDPRLPAIAGQRIDYLEKVLHAYRKGERSSREMAAMSEMLSEQDVPVLAAYYGRQKGRAVVYVTLPAR